MLSGSSPGQWAVLKLLCCPSKEEGTFRKHFPNPFSQPDAPECRILCSLPVRNTILKYIGHECCPFYFCMLDCECISKVLLNFRNRRRRYSESEEYDTDTSGGGGGGDRYESRSTFLVLFLMFFLEAKPRRSMDHKISFGAEREEVCRKSILLGKFSKLRGWVGWGGVHLSPWKIEQAISSDLFSGQISCMITQCHRSVGHCPLIEVSPFPQIQPSSSS